MGDRLGTPSVVGFLYFLHIISVLKHFYKLVRRFTPDFKVHTCVYATLFIFGTYNMQKFAKYYISYSFHFAIEM